MWRNSRTALGCFVVVAYQLSAQEPVFRTSAQVVTVTVSVTDSNRRPVPGMTAGEFIVLDDARPRELQSFSHDVDLPLTLGLIADNSGTQSRFIRKHRDDLRHFLRQVLHPGDRAFLVSIPGPALLSQDMTDSVKLLESAVNNLQNLGRGSIFGGDCPDPVAFETDCGSLIWNGVWGAASLKLRKEQGRKAILLLSDGIDTGSEHDLVDAIEAAQSADAPVYTISSPSSLPFRSLVRLNSRGRSHMKRLSEDTGGGAFDDQDNLSKVFAQIEAELRHLYVLSFAIPVEERDGKFHNLTVRSTRPGVRVRARSGYVAK